jgi:hypothetical protein
MEIEMEMGMGIIFRRWRRRGSAGGKWPSTTDMYLVASGHSSHSLPTHPSTAEAFRGSSLWGKGGFASGTNEE